MFHSSIHPRDATISLVVEVPVSHLQRLHTLLDADHSLSVKQIIQSALLLYLAYKLPDFCCRPSLFSTHHEHDFSLDRTDADP